MDLRRIPTRCVRSARSPIFDLCRLLSARVRRRALLGVTLLVVLVWGAVPVRAEITVARASFATGVVAREPVGAADRFPPSVERVYFFTQLFGADAPTDILHVWMFGGEEKAIVPLSVGAGSWRTWSSKKILPSWLGQWTVEVRDLGGRVLASRTFQIE